MIHLLHPAGRRGAEEAGAAAAILARALGGEVETRPFSPGEREGVVRGESPPGAWALLLGPDLVLGPALLPGPDLVGAAALPPGKVVVLARRDPRWSLEDMVGRPLDRLPAGARVTVGSDLGAALLRRARPDLVPVRAGAFPAPEETPVLAEGPYDGRPAGLPLDPAIFVPAPGTGIAALLAPRGAGGGGEAVPPAVRAAEDADARIALDIERGLVAGVGELPPGGALGGLAKRRVSVLFALRAVLFLPGADPRDLRADIPLADARVFARGFGRHLRTPT